MKVSIVDAELILLKHQSLSNFTWKKNNYRDLKESAELVLPGRNLSNMSQSNKKNDNNEIDRR